MAEKHNPRRAATVSPVFRRVIVICEGPTEQQFCNTVLKPWFLQKNIEIQPPLIKKSSGGIVHWAALKKEIESHLKQDTSALVTMLVDYYGIPAGYNFPEWSRAHEEADKTRRMRILERGMLEAIPDRLRRRFIPYLQLHEFEGILFSDKDVFLRTFGREEFTDLPGFLHIFDEFPNPENINDRPESCPSRRLSQHIQGYNKVLYGAILAEEIGIETIISKCPRFALWINSIPGVV